MFFQQKSGPPSEWMSKELGAKILARHFYHQPVQHYCGIVGRGIKLERFEVLINTEKNAITSCKIDRYGGNTNVLWALTPRAPW